MKEHNTLLRKYIFNNTLDSIDSIPISTLDYAVILKAGIRSMIVVNGRMFYQVNMNFMAS